MSCIASQLSRSAGLTPLALCAVVFGFTVSCAKVAQAQKFVLASAYSFDAPTDLYLSEDPSGCDNHTRGVRAWGTRVLAITLYPDAYCSLMQGASCQYTFVPDESRAFASGEFGIRRSHFTATWDDACTGQKQVLAGVMHGSLIVSDASDLGLQGTYDLTLADGATLRGVFDSAQCPMPRRAHISCF